MIAPGQVYPSGVHNLENEKIQDGLQGVVASINVVANKKVLGRWDFAACVSK